MRSTMKRTFDVLSTIGEHVAGMLVILLASGVALTTMAGTLATRTDQPASVAYATDVPTDPTEILRLPEGSVLETTPLVPVPGTRYVVPEESPDGGHVLPVALWLDNSPVYSGPQSWVLHVDDKQQRVTWRKYVDGVSGADAAPVESVRIVNVAHATSTDRPTAQERKAARLILARMKSGKRYFENWTWKGAPRVVGQQNDALIERFEQTGLKSTRTNVRAFLAKVAAGKAVGKATAGTGGKVLAEDGSFVPRSFYDHVRGPSKATCDYLGKRLVPDPRFGTRCVR